MIEELKKIHACKEALQFIEGFGSLQEAWDNMERADWMAWILGKTCDNVDELLTVLAECAIDGEVENNKIERFVKRIERENNSYRRALNMAYFMALTKTNVCDRIRDYYPKSPI